MKSGFLFFNKNYQQIAYSNVLKLHFFHAIPKAAIQDQSFLNNKSLSVVIQQESF